MAERMQWIEHKGKKMLLCDFSNFTEKDYLDGTDIMERELLKQAPGSKVRLIVNVTNSWMNKATIDRGQKTVEILSKAGVVTITAIVGITGIKRVLAQVISRDVYFAKNLEDAKNWLAAQ